MKIPGHFSENLEKVFWVKNTYSLMQNRIRNLSDPGSGMEKFESGIRCNIPDPQHCQRVPYIFVKNIRNRPKNFTRKVMIWMSHN